MKGVLVALLTVILYAVSIVLAAHFLRPRRHSRLLMLTMIPWIACYFTIYFVTPDDCFVLPLGWRLTPRWLDALYGVVVLILCCHNFGFLVFSICAGFSVALLAAIHQTPAHVSTTKILVDKFKLADGSDRVYSWRVPHLERSGYLQKDSATGKLCLTAKGRLIALIAYLLKRAMNLGEGG